MSLDPQDEAPDLAIRERVRVPGSLLMWIGIFNLVGGLLLLQTGVQILKKTPAQFREDQKEAAGWLKKIGLPVDGAGRPEMDMPIEDLQALNAHSFIAWAVLSFVGSFVTTYGGYNLRTLNSYKMATAGAILAAVPCTSPASVCGIGIVVGIWALVVLMNREVRSAFP